MPYLFFKNYKNQDLWAKIFQITAIPIFCCDFSLIWVMMMLLFQLWWLMHASGFILSACFFMKTHLIALLQDNCLDLIRCAFKHKLPGCMTNISVSSTPTKADKIGCFGQYRYINETQTSARPIYQSSLTK